jgi:PAS fold/GAF domain
MKTASFPKDEKERLETLRNYKILDTPPEQVFDDLTALASYICKTPIALISLVDESRQWFKSKVGIDAQDAPRDLAFCAHAILQEKVFIVPDSFQDDRFHDNPFVTGPAQVRFYAGAPLITPNGKKIGTICVIDHIPRQLSSQETGALEALARQVVSQIELRYLLSEERKALITAEKAENIGKFGSWDLDLKTMYGKWSKGHYSIFDLEPNEPPPSFDAFLQMIHPEDRQTILSIPRKLIEGKKDSIELEYRVISPKTHRVKWIKGYTGLERDEAGNPIMLMGTIQDITEKKALKSKQIPKVKK